MMMVDPKIEAIINAHRKYEWAATETRHTRDVALSKAWREFEKRMAAHWDEYMKVPNALDRLEKPK